MSSSFGGWICLVLSLSYFRLLMIVELVVVVEGMKVIRDIVFLYFVSRWLVSLVLSLARLVFVGG